MKNSERNGCIDIAKGIGILLVVFAHVNYTQPYQNIIYGFHMPLFFLISGILFVPERYSDFGAFVKRKAKTLLCHYVLFALITVLCQMCFNYISGYGIKALAGIGGYNDHDLLQSILPFVAVFAASVVFAAVYMRVKNRMTKKSKCG